MLRHVILVIGAGLIALPPAYAQSICNDAEVVFVGRAEAPVTDHVSGEREIEAARQNFLRTEEEISRLQASLDERTRLERAAEFAIRVIKAKDEWSMRRAKYPQPYDVTFIPLQIIRPFRGVSEPALMVFARQGLPPILPGEDYLIYGRRSKNFIPPFPEMSELYSLSDYVEAQSALPVAGARQQLEFLSATMSGATVMGTLRMHSFGGMAPPLAGVRVLVSSGAQVVEATTRQDGGFLASGLRAGELNVTPVLSADLTIVDQYPRKVVVPEGGCVSMELRAAVDGRVRGRVFAATTGSLDMVHLTLQIMRADRRMTGSHDPVFSTKARPDGTFEFSGVSAGTYLLSARVQNPDGGNSPVGATYYPGTSDVDAAAPIVVGKASQHDGFDFVIPFTTAGAP